MAAKNFFATQLPKPPYNRNEFGANLSGPLVIPRLYNGRNKTFFLVDYEGFRLVQATTSSAGGDCGNAAGQFRGTGHNHRSADRDSVPGKHNPEIATESGNAAPGPTVPASEHAGNRRRRHRREPGGEIATNQTVDRGSVRVDQRISDKTQLAFSFLTRKPGSQSAGRLSQHLRWNGRNR